MSRVQCIGFRVPASFLLTMISAGERSLSETSEHLYEQTFQTWIRAHKQASLGKRKQAKT